MADKKYYSVNTEKKVITIDNSVIPTKEDEREIQMYINGGYKLRRKSEKRAEKAKERSVKDGMDKATIDATLEKYPDYKKVFDEIKSGRGKGKGYFAAKKWYKDIALPEIKKEAEKKSK